MQTLQTILFVLQIFVAVTLIGFVLIQHGKGADAGAAFGSGASATVFGSRGSGNFLTKTTTVLAIIFLANSLLLGYLAAEMVQGKGSLLDEVPASVTQPQELPAPVGEPASPTAPADLSAATPPQDKPADVPLIPGTNEPPATDMPAVPE